MDDKGLLTVEEAAKFLRVETKTVYRLINNKDLKAVSVERLYRIDAKDLQEFIQKSKIKVQKAPKKKY